MENWVARDINQRYRVRMPDWLAAWDAWSEWERKRFEHMEARLKKGDILFDVGSESGGISCVYAQFVGGENMVLFEGTPEFWPNLMEMWNENGLPDPKACVNALVSDKVQRAELFPLWSGTERVGDQPWPPSAYGGEMTKARSYRYIHEHAHSTPQITIDDFVALSKIVPAAMTIDVEGAEMKVLKGAERTLLMHKPLVWVSVHPDLMLRDYKSAIGELHGFMDSLGYTENYINTDHEVHMFYEPR